MISSTSNPAVKRVRALRHRKERDATGAFWVEGIRPVGLAAETNAAIHMVILAPDLLNSRFAEETITRLRSSGIPILEVTAAVFHSISEREGPQGIGAVVGQRWTSLPQTQLSGGLCWIALDRLADPGNLGTVVRTGDAVGAAGIILIGHTADPFDPAAVRGSMGTVVSTPLVRTTETEFLRWARNSGTMMVGTSDRGAVDYREAAYVRPLVLLVGSERQGLSSGLLEACAEVVRVPMAGRSDSLNLAVATGVVLYEVFERARRAQTELT